MASIEIKRLPILGVGGHIYIEFFDDEGNRVAQYNGFAEDPNTGEVKTVGDVTNGDRLKLYSSNDEDVNKRKVLGGTAGATKDNHPHEGVEIWEGTEEEMQEAIDALDAYKEDFNEADLPYDLNASKDPLSDNDYYNSNSGASGMLDVLEEELDVDDEAVEEGKDLGPLPGSWGNPGINDDMSDVVDGSEHSNNDVNPETEKEAQEDLIEGEEGDDILLGKGGNDEMLDAMLDNDYEDDVESKVGDAKSNGSPLVLDLNNDGIELTSLQSGGAVYWDIDVDGFAEASGWITGGDGLLAIDLNEDGKINNSSELFGDQTGFSNGFAALAFYDSNEDGIISNADTQWDDLIVWIDADIDGVTNAGELHTLDDLSITEISLSYSSTSQTIAGNHVGEISTFKINGNTQDIADVYFQYDNMDTVSDISIDFDPRVLFTPNLKGYGNIHSLYIALSSDNDDQNTDSLMSLILDFSELELEDVFTNDSSALDKITDIMYRWAGVDGVATDSRGPNIDARKLEFLEAFTGQPFFQTGSAGQPDPGYWAAQNLEEAFHIAQQNIFARLIAQTASASLFEGEMYYNNFNDTFQGVTGLNTATIDALEILGMSATAPEVFWANVVRVIEFTIGTDNLSTADETYLDDAIYATDNSLTLSNIVDSLDFYAPNGSTFNGTSGVDTLTGGVGDDTLNGEYGNDTLEGGIGGDVLYGGGDNDVLWGESGSDYLLGGTGNDRYHWEAGHGHDIIKEQSDAAGNLDDRIVLGSGFDIGDLTITRISNTGLFIEIDNGSQIGSILIEDQFNVGTYGGRVELIEFSDTSTYSLVNQSYTLTGTDSGDNLEGITIGGLNTDIIYGGGGNDQIDGHAGNDILYGDAGQDTIYGGDDNDTIYGGVGNDKLYGEGGNDTIYMGAGNDVANGGASDDTYHYVSGLDVLIDQGGTDTIYLDAVWDAVTPSYFKQANDLKIVFDSNNSIVIDNYFVGSGSIETMIYNDSTSVTLGSVSYTVQGDSSGNTINGTNNDDKLYGFGGNDTIHGNNGNDELYGGLGDDYMTGGYGNDYLDGGAGDDDMRGANDDDHYYYVSGNDFIYDTIGSDLLELAPGWDMNDLTFRRYDADERDLIIEINGSNTITINDFFYSNKQVETLRLHDGSGDTTLTGLQYETHGDAGSNTMNGIIVGGSINDIMYGHDGNDDLNGGNGDDVLYGGNGNDDLDGGYGMDILDGGAGNDDLYGSAGEDVYIYTSGLDMIDDLGLDTDILKIIGGTTINDISITNTGSYDATIIINAGIDEILIDNLRYSNGYVDIAEFDDGFAANLKTYTGWNWGTSSGETLNGGTGDDTIIGKAGADTLNGNAGNDAMHGGADADVLYGHAGTDLLHGGTGDDTLYGGDDLDTMYGGAGADTFIFESATAFNDLDIIMDFDGVDDVIDVSDLLSAYTSGSDDINDFVSLSESNGDTILAVDQDGTGATYSAQNIINLKAVIGLNVDDMVTGGQLAVV